jgi:serine/threonine protein kinase
MAPNQPAGPPGDEPEDAGDLPTSIRTSDAGLKSHPVASSAGAAASPPAAAPPPPPRSTAPGLGPASIPPRSSAPPRASAPPPPTRASAPPRTTAPGLAPAPVATPPIAATATPTATTTGTPPAPGSDELAIELDDADEVVESIGGRRVSLASLVHLAPVGRYGKFDLLGRIAYGGMAEIFLAREIQEGRAGRFVVVKRVLPHVAGDKQFVDMFTDEARLVMQLSHPNICHVYSYGKEEGAPFISMEWVNGMPLSRVLRRGKTAGGISVPLVLKVVAQIADALDHAHRAMDQSTNEPLGIVHRDVSPQNIMVSFEGVVKLLDFGIAKAASHSTRTEAGTIKGKFAYMAPEQCLGEPLDARADVFALGVVLLEMLSGGNNPFKKQTEFDTMRALVYEEIAPISLVNPAVTPELEAIVRKAIAKKREDRYQSAADLGLALERELGRTGEVVNTARIGDRMNELFREEIKAGPRLDTRIQVPPRKDGTSDADIPRASMPPNATEKIATLTTDQAAEKLASAARVATGSFRSEAPPAEPPRRARWPLFVAALLLFAALGAGAAIVLRPDTAVAPLPGSVAGVPAVPVVAPPVPVPPAPPVAPVTGTLFVDSTPGGATVTLGERGVVGTTPMELALLDTGDWNIRMHLDGFEDWEDTVELRPGERMRVFGELTAIARGRRPDRGPDLTSEETPAPVTEPGRLSLNTRPWSRVYVGSRLLGTTPLGDVEVPSGTVRLRLVDRDGAEHTRSVSVAAGGHTREFFDLSAEESPPPE